MNIRAVLRTYGMLRSLTDDETALLETLRSLNDSEREALTLAMEPPKVVKKSSKKPAVKSARAASLGAAVKGSLGRQSGNGACTFVLENGATCNTGDNNPIHDPVFGYAGYHAFTPAPATTAKDDSYRVNVGGVSRG